MLLQICSSLDYCNILYLFRPYIPKPGRQDSKSDSPSLKRYTMLSESGSSPQSSPQQKRASTGSLSLQFNQAQPEHIIHAGAVMSIFHLLPAIGCQNYQVMQSMINKYSRLSLSRLLLSRTTAYLEEKIWSLL